MMKKIIENIVVFVATIVVMFLLATMILPRFDYNLIVIRSGSMEPTIKTGSIVLSKKQNDYREGDIITFARVGNEIVTHRIIRILNDDNDARYKTKGDANNSEDLVTVSKNRVIGKTLFNISYLGYLIAFLKSKWGIVILIFLPAGYFIVNEILKIRKELKNRSTT